MALTQETIAVPRLKRDVNGDKIALRIQLGLNRKCPKNPSRRKEECSLGQMDAGTYASTGAKTKMILLLMVA